MKRLPPAAIPVAAGAMGLPTMVAPETVVAQVTYAVGFCFVVVMAWAGVRARPAGARHSYALMATGLTVWLAGDVVYAVMSWLLGPLPDFSPADVLWILGYPLLAAAMMAMTRSRAPGRIREGLLDGAAMSTVVAALLVQFMILPAASDGLSAAGLAGALYPFGDVLLFAAAAVLVFSPGDRAGPTRYLIVAFMLTFFSDVAISAAPMLVPSFDEGRLDGLLLIANSLIAAALWHPQAQRLTQRQSRDDTRLHPARVGFLGVSLLALPALADLQGTRVFVDRLTSLLTMIMLTVIVLIRFTYVVRDQERVRRDLAWRVTHDSLTGLVNRHELYSRLDRALPPAAIGDHPTVYFLDLDGFKLINDVHGHAAGDYLLVETARRLRSVVRGSDIVARLGGDEFVVFTLNHDGSLADRLRRAVGAPLHHAGHELTVGVSIGVVSASDPRTLTTDALLAAADADMYRDKAQRSRRRAAEPVLANLQVPDA